MVYGTCDFETVSYYLHLSIRVKSPDYLTCLMTRTSKQDGMETQQLSCEAKRLF